MKIVIKALGLDMENFSNRFCGEGDSMSRTAELNKPEMIHWQEISALILTNENKTQLIMKIPELKEHCGTYQSIVGGVYVNK